MNNNQIFEQAIIIHHEGKLEEAERLYKEILETEPTNHIILNNLANLFNTLGRKEEAIDAYKKAVLFKPEFIEAHYNYASVLYSLGRLDEAEISYKKVLELKPNWVEAHFNLGNVFNKLEKFDLAEASYRKSIELQADYSNAYINLSLMLHALERSDEAEECYVKLIKFLPNSEIVYNNLGNLKKDLNKLDEAEVCYRKAIKLNADYFPVYTNLGATLRRLDRLEEAEEILNKGLNLKANYEGYFNRGHVLFEQKKFELALRDYDICNTEDSRAKSLSCLYALGRIEEIYQRIASQSELDEKNLRTAAFSAFISYKEKKVTAHKFCNNPIDFIKFSNLSSHLKDSNLLINEVIEELHNLKMVWEPSGKPVFKAFQSNFNLFENPSEKINDLKSIIMNEIDSYHLKFKNETCSFIKKWPSEKNINGWYVIYKQQGFQTEHDHPTGWLSGVIYLKVVPPLEKNEGAIEFGLNSKLYFDENSPKIIHQPKTGDIVLFPSSLQHRTIPFTTDTNRIIISFDLRPDVKN